MTCLLSDLQRSQSVQSVGGLDDLFALRFTAFTAFRDVGGVDNLFALRFTAFTAFKAWGV